MFNGLKIGQTGMNTAQKVMDNVADKIANGSTPGYKKAQVGFQELLRNEMGSQEVRLGQSAQGSSVGIGSRAVRQKTDFTPGAILPTEGPWDLALEGEGFFGVLLEEGTLALTRNGAFVRGADGQVMDSQGHPLVIDAFLPEASWPSGKLTVTADGRILGDENQALGQILRFSPGNSDELIPLGEGRFLPGAGADVRNSRENPEYTFGTIRQGALESSNADALESLTEMIVTQRAYQASAKALTSADEMLEAINTIL